MQDVANGVSPDRITFLRSSTVITCNYQIQIVKLTKEFFRSYQSSIIFKFVQINNCAYWIHNNPINSIKIAQI